MHEIELAIIGNCLRKDKVFDVGDDARLCRSDVVSWVSILD